MVKPTFRLGLVLAFQIMLSAHTSAESVPVITLGGEVGAAANANLVRFRSVPFDSVP